MKRHGAYQRPGALDPWEHNRIVAQRKKYRRLARSFRQAARTVATMRRAFLAMGAAAQHAAESLRCIGSIE